MGFPPINPMQPGEPSYVRNAYARNMRISRSKSSNHVGKEKEGDAWVQRRENQQDHEDREERERAEEATEDGESLSEEA